MCNTADPGGWASRIVRNNFPFVKSHIVICKINQYMKLIYYMLFIA